MGEYQILEKVSLFQGIQKSEISDVLNCMDSNTKKYSKNQIIVRGGMKMNNLGIILDGSVQVIREDIMGNRMIVASLFSGEIFGETFACAGVDASPVSVIADEDSTILWIALTRIVTPCTTACDFHSQLIMNLLQILAKKNLYLNNKMELLSKRSIREKILSYLAEQANKHKTAVFEIPLNRNEMADYLCIDRSAMSRELSKLKEEGILDYHKNSFRFLKK
ncbi:MAG: cyclic nucleotide-binding protein [Anaerocolumna sp.]|jgi:CRP-like cAMP-binding protein|nr:cyclic nucleotide-binding protein [Anaerocolumna sp.]